jgi:hypothetical protein
VLLARRLRGHQVVRHHDPVPASSLFIVCRSTGRDSPLLRLGLRGAPQEDAQQPPPQRRRRRPPQRVYALGARRLPAVSLRRHLRRAAAHVVRVLVSRGQDEVGLGADAAVPGAHGVGGDLPLREGALVPARPLQRRRPPHDARRAAAPQRRAAPMADAAQVAAALRRTDFRKCVGRALGRLRPGGRRGVAHSALWVAEI